MKKKISAKILVLVGILFAAGVASVITGFVFVYSVNSKSQKISNECMEAVTLMSDTSTSIEKVQKYANSSAAFRMQNQMSDKNAAPENVEEQVNDMTPGNSGAVQMNQEAVSAGSTSKGDEVDNAADMKASMENEIQNLTNSFTALEEAVG